MGHCSGKTMKNAYFVGYIFTATMSHTIQMTQDIKKADHLKSDHKPSEPACHIL